MTLADRPDVVRFFERGAKLIVTTETRCLVLFWKGPFGSAPINHFDLVAFESNLDAAIFIGMHGHNRTLFVPLER